MRPTRVSPVVLSAMAYWMTPSPMPVRAPMMVIQSQSEMASQTASMGAATPNCPVPALLPTSATAGLMLSS